MSRCQHGFELTRLKCPSGCGGQRSMQRHVGTGRATKPEPKQQPRRCLAVTEAEIAAALASSPGVRHAREKLGISEGTMVKHVRASAELQRLYAEAKERGHRVSRERYGWRKF